MAFCPIEVSRPPVRLLLITTDIFRPGTHAAAVAAALHGAGHDVFVAAPPAGASAETAHDRLAIAGWLPLRRGRRLLALAVNLWAVSRWARELSPDLLLADSPAAGLIANVARGAAGNGVLSVLMLDHLPPTAGFLDRVLAAKAIQECDRLLIPLADLREALLPRGARRADVLIAADATQVAMLCQDLERENALVRPRPVPRGP